MPDMYLIEDSIRRFYIDSVPMYFQGECTHHVHQQFNLTMTLWSIESQT